MIKTGSDTFHPSTLQVLEAGLHEDDGYLLDVLSGLSKDQMSQHMGGAVCLAASIQNLQVVEFLLNQEASKYIHPNGENGLGRALFLGCQTGIEGIVERILKHQSAHEILEHGRYSLNHARAAAAAKNHYTILSILSSNTSSAKD